MDCLKINFFGGFSIVNGDNFINDSVNRSKKIWTALEYLVFYRGNDITQSDLIDLLWGEDECENPVGALKTLMHRVRSVLDELKYPEELILQRHGTYFWNTSVPVVSDTTDFVERCREGADASLTEERRLEARLAAAELYEGDFLPKASFDSWAIPLVAYYRHMYIETVGAAAELLDSRERWNDIIELCSRAVTVDPYCEKLHYYYIKALDCAGNHASALKQYDSVLELFYTELGVNPSLELTELYRSIAKSQQNVETDLDIIKSDLRESVAKPGAFYCEYEIFRDIYRIESRASARSGASNYICLITVNNKREDDAVRKRVNRVMDVLRDSITISLRRGDVFSRYSVTQYIIMLPNVNYEQGVMVAERILRRYRSEYPKGDISVEYKLRSLEPNVLD